MKEKETKRQFVQKVRTTITEIKSVSPDISRMEAWKITVDTGCDVPWEMFKRFWHETR